MKKRVAKHTSSARTKYKNMWAAFRSKKDSSSTAAARMGSVAVAKAGDHSSISRYSSLSERLPDTAAV